jgi:hypothetical protein
MLIADIQILESLERADMSRQPRAAAGKHGNHC